MREMTIACDLEMRGATVEYFLVALGGVLGFFISRILEALCR